MNDDDESEDFRELKEELRNLRAEIRREVADAVSSSSKGIHVDIQSDEMAQTEPSQVIVKDLVRLIRDNVKSSLAQRGEMAVDDLVEAMPEDKAVDLLKSLANNQRMKIAKMLYTRNRPTSELRDALGIEAPGLSYHMKSLTDLGLVAHGDEGGYVLTKRGRLLVRTLALMNEALGGEKVD